MPRKQSLGVRYTRIKNIILKTLKDSQVYDPTDDILIDELLYNIKLSDDAKKDIKKYGFKQNVVKDPKKDPYYQANPSVSTYIQTSKNIAALLTKLGITPQERIKLEIESKEEDQLKLLLEQSTTNTSNNGSKKPANFEV